jgi:hypothetical protein
MQQHELTVGAAVMMAAHQMRTWQHELTAGAAAMMVAPKM